MTTFSDDAIEYPEDELLDDVIEDDIEPDEEPLLD